ncbi:MAG: 23S rRNA (guanosine(2251)-2'-O)-methyltransferase RlmB [Gammaproteobacteria bacterium 28-57-27]|nr:MAG: 23S rRNA (guanosine(2251)-2'-O)-methyltransferase RlmB [Gammaproteobacteria bacterium 28-57-27]
MFTARRKTHVEDELTEAVSPKQDQKQETSARADLWLFGLHAIESVLKNDPENIIRLLCAEGRRDQRLQHVEALAQEVGVKINRVEMRELDKLTRVDRHQGVAAQYRPPRSYDENDLYALLDRLDEPALLLVLDGVTDPHNLGACLRVADGAGVHAVIAPKDRAASLTPTARKVASGAAESLPFVQVTNLARTLDTLKQRDIWIVGLAGEADHMLYASDVSKHALAVVMGAEGSGLRRLTRESCDELVKLPMLGTVESLNVSVAAGVTLYEIRRQRMSKAPPA